MKNVKHTFIECDGSSLGKLRKAFAEIDSQPEWEVVSVLDLQVGLFGNPKFLIIVRIPG